VGSQPQNTSTIAPGRVDEREKADDDRRADCRDGTHDKQVVESVLRSAGLLNHLA
jgi:hypothetical protein